jgi:hypothetical protein
VLRSGGGGPLHPVGQPSVGELGEPLEGEGPPGTVGAEALQPEDVILVKPAVGVEREALHEGAAAARTPGPRRPGGWNLDTPELEELEGLLRGSPLLEDAACAKR